MPKILVNTLLVVVLLGLGFAAGWLLHDWGVEYLASNPELLTPITAKPSPSDPPLAKYYLPRLAQQTFTAPGPLSIQEVIATEASYTSYLFTYQTQGKTISGQLNIPSTPAPSAGYPTIVMLRGYVPLEIYKTGVGTKNAAAVFASQGFVTIAPDFLGFGQSDPDVTDTWESRFIKPVQVAELMSSIQKYPQLSSELPVTTLSSAPQLNPAKLGLWAHSNGGQIALTTLEITGQPLPTTLWAPVTAPFPYSVTFFSDELPDEGKEQRAWIALFEKEYDVFGFSISKNLELLPDATIQIHHGTVDEAAPIAWSQEFVQKVELENKHRATFSAEFKATASANLKHRLSPTNITLFEYPNTDHNLQPSWNTAVQRDVAFFKKELL